MKKLDIPQGYCESINCAAARSDRAGCLYFAYLEPECTRPGVSEQAVRRWMEEQAEKQKLRTKRGPRVSKKT